MKKINVTCPHCSKKFSYYSSEFRPFCSEQCKMVDLNGWLSEDYKLAGSDNTLYIEDEEVLQKLLDETDETY